MTVTQEQVAVTTRSNDILFQSFAEKSETMLAEISATRMAEYVGTDFEVLDDPANVFCLKLTGVVEQAKTERSEAFSLFFHGPLDRFMPQSIHRLRHLGLGELEIFLVPVAQGNGGFQYEAVFNHML